MIALPVLSCTSPACGACCMEQAGLPVTWYAKLDPDAQLPPALHKEVEEMAAGWFVNDIWHGPHDGDPCVWFDAETRLCKHYEHRPEICRTEVVPGDEACLLWRERKMIT